MYSKKVNNLPIGIKITLWFSIALVFVVILTYIGIFTVSEKIIHKSIKDNLISTIEHNVDEIEYYSTIIDAKLASDVDYFLPYKEGYLEVDDDFLDEVNQIYTTLYTVDGTFIYGENPIALETTKLKFIDSSIQELVVDKTLYFVFDRKLTKDNLDGLWLRGVVSEKQGEVEFKNAQRISLIILPAFVFIAIIGGYILAKKMLNPIQKLSDSVSQIRASGDLKKRIDIGKGNDEIHQLTDNFNSMFDRLDKSFQLEKQFTSDVSHELRTPMSVILAQCELSLENKQSIKQYQEALELINRQATKMNKLINDMLDFTRLEMKSEKYTKQHFNLSELIKSVCIDSALIKEKNISLYYEIKDNVIFNGNMELINRLINNLISNAYKYGKDNGHILVSLNEDKDNIVLTVKDDGIGVEKSQQDKIFNRFYQVDTAHSNNGNGLGLSMVLEIVKFHDGSIKVDSELNKGSTFTVILSK